MHLYYNESLTKSVFNQGYIKPYLIWVTIKTVVPTVNSMHKQELYEVIESELFYSRTWIIAKLKEGTGIFWDVSYPRYHIYTEKEVYARFNVKTEERKYIDLKEFAAANCYKQIRYLFGLNY